MAVPSLTLTVTVFASVKRAAPSISAVTVMIVAPSSSATESGLAVSVIPEGSVSSSVTVTGRFVVCPS